MSGHNKWSKIKRLKGAADAKRGRVFSKLAREIMIATRENGGDPAMNATLRMVLLKCKSVNMPSDSVDRAIKKGTGGDGADIFEELNYEVYGPGGVAILVEIATDNRNRTAGTIRHILSKNNGNMASAGSVARLFQRRGQIIIPRQGNDEDKLMELALEAGAEDFKAEPEGFEILTDPAAFETVYMSVESAGVTAEGAEVTFLPTTTVALDVHAAKDVNRLVEALEDYEDVKEVHTNAEFPEESQD